jgi:hypothetical protein
VSVRAPDPQHQHPLHASVVEQRAPSCWTRPAHAAHAPAPGGCCGGSMGCPPPTPARPCRHTSTVCLVRPGASAWGLLLPPLPPPLTRAMRQADHDGVRPSPRLPTNTPAG